MNVVARVIRGVTLDGLLERPLRRFLTEVMLAAHANVAQPGRVPIRTGLLRSSLAPGGGVTMVDPNSPPEWSQVGTDKTYAAPLDKPVDRDPHYADGPSRGQPTAGWLSNTPAQIDSQIVKMRSELAKDIVASWRGK